MKNLLTALYLTVITALFLLNITAQQKQNAAEKSGSDFAAVNSPEMQKLLSDAVS